VKYFETAFMPKYAGGQNLTKEMMMNTGRNKLVYSFLLAAVGVLLCGCDSEQPAAEKEKSGPPQDPVLTFSVSGYGKAFYAANTCDLVFGIETTSEDVVECQRHHEESIAKVTDYVKTGTPKDTIFGQVSTDLSIIHPRNQEKDLYRYETLFSMRMKAVSQLRALQAELVQRGVNKIVTVELLSDKQRELIDEARKLAIEDAKRKARFLASQAGWQLLGIKDIRFDEESYRKGRLARTHGTRAGYSEDSGAEAAETFVDSGMTVTFEYRRNDRKL
jgi:uncharacterized protein YggE